MTELLEIGVLGGLRIRRGDTLVAGLGSKNAALFVYLAVTGLPQPRAALADLLWEESESDAAKRSLRQALSTVRGKLGKNFIPENPLDPVTFDRTQPHRLDLALLEQHLEDAIAARSGTTGLTATARDHLKHAVALYTGPFLQAFSAGDAGNFETWMLDKQHHVDRQVRNALHDLVADALASGAYADGEQYATRLLEIDPLDEQAHQDLMRLLAYRGQRHGAHAQYLELQRVLDEDGAEPLPELTALDEAIQRGEIVAPRVPGNPAPAVVTAIRPENLPVQLTPFVGREVELAALRLRLAEPLTRLVTIAGLGGSGKSRLAAEAVPALDGFPDGIYFVQLAAVPEPPMVATAVAQAIDLTFSGGRDPWAQLSDYLRDKDLLLVLDGFEHLLDAADMVIDLLQQAPHLKLLVTSRRPLQLAAEQIFDLRGLAVPPGGAKAVGDYPAAQLFVQRAQRVEPQFTLTPELAPAVVRICRLVEGLPLGLELAAGWVRSQSCQAIADDLTTSLDVLATSHRDVPERHRSMRAVFDQSWLRLSPEEQGVFAQLAVLRGGFADDAARAVAGEGIRWSRALLPALVQQSLLRHSPTGRYEMHELVHQYAAERLAQDPEVARAAARRHAAYYLHLAETAAVHFRRPDEARRLVQLEQEHDNLRRALEWSLRPGAGDPEVAIRLAAALGGFWQGHGHLSEGRNWLRAVLNSAAGLDTPARVWSGYWAGTLARQQGDLDEAHERLDAALALARAMRKEAADEQGNEPG